MGLGKASLFGARRDSNVSSGKGFPYSLVTYINFQTKMLSGQGVLIYYYYGPLENMNLFPFNFISVTTSHGTLVKSKLKRS